jgi:uncharacterized membrane protein YfcA
MHYIIAGLIGLTSGVISGLFGVGGGIVMVPAMLFFLKADINIAVGTSLGVIVPTAMMGALKHYQLGNLDWKVALSLAPLAILGGYLGAWLTVPIPPETLKRMFGGLLIVVGIRLIFFK